MNISVTQIKNILRTANSIKVLENAKMIKMPSDPAEHIDMMANLVWKALNDNGE